MEKRYRIERETERWFKIDAGLRGSISRMLRHHRHTHTHTHTHSAVKMLSFNRDLSIQTPHTPVTMTTELRTSLAHYLFTLLRNSLARSTERKLRPPAHRRWHINISAKHAGRRPMTEFTVSTHRLCLELNTSIHFITIYHETIMLNV